MLRIARLRWIPLLVSLVACTDDSATTTARLDTGTGSDTDSDTDSDTTTDPSSESSSDTDGGETGAELCGNGQVELDEACDDGNQDDSDACLSDCTAASCGDGHVGPGEACDDGNQTDDDACPSTCQLASCGDGVVRVDEEACDDGNQVDTDACLTTCEAAACGDGVVWTDEEPCDDGNADNTDTCLVGCIVASCGDGYVGPGEGCDDGNTVDDDTCTNACALASCGDGQVQVGEACDDGNDDDSDACLATCTAAACGDGQPWAGQEQCDDQNVDNGDACLASCELASCGDGYTWIGEELCDDGNQDDSDACTGLCAPPTCDDGLKSGSEVGIDCGGECPAQCLVPDNWYFPIVDGDDYTIIAAMYADGAEVTLVASTGPNAEFGGQQWPNGVHLIRLDNTGSMILYKELPNVGFTTLRPVASGGFIGAGGTSNAATFGAGEPNEETIPAGTSYTAFLAKYADDGQLEWLDHHDEVGSEFFMDALPLSDGSYMVIAHFTGSMTLNPGQPNELVMAGPASNEYMLVSRFEPGVGYVWAQTWVGGLYDSAVALADDSVVISGRHDTDLIYGYGTAEQSVHALWGTHDAFVTRIAADGERLWEGQLGGGFATYAKDLDVAPDGSAVYLAGEWTGSASFDPLAQGQATLASQAGYDAFVMRLGLDGTLEWMRTATSTGHVMGRGVAALTNGNVVFGGMFEQTVALGGADPNAVEYVEAGYIWTTDPYLATYTATGDFVSAAHIRGLLDDELMDIEPAGEAILVDVMYLGMNNPPFEPGNIVFMPGEATEAVIPGIWTERVLARIVP